jgi:hypothetical protein
MPLQKNTSLTILAMSCIVSLLIESNLNLAPASAESNQCLIAEHEINLALNTKNNDLFIKTTIFPDEKKPQWRDAPYGRIFMFGTGSDISINTYEASKRIISNCERTIAVIFISNGKSKKPSFNAYGVVRGRVVRFKNIKPNSDKSIDNWCSKWGYMCGFDI